MCGLAGVVGNTINQDDFNNFNKLLYISAFRGTDSTGVVLVPKTAKTEATVVKDVMDPASFIRYNGPYNEVEGKDVFACLGHTRSATEGSVNLDNAQPVLSGKLMGTHNGTISFLADKTTDTSDSRNLYALIAEQGVNVLREINTKGGAFALVWYDREDNTVNFIRNDSRPLFYTRHNGVIYYASEKSFLTFVLSRNSSSKWEREITCEEFEYGVLYKIKRHSGLTFTKETIFSRPVYNPVVHVSTSSKGGQAPANGVTPFRRTFPTTTTPTRQPQHTPTTILSGELDRHLRTNTVKPDWEAKGEEVQKEEGKGKPLAIPPPSGKPSSNGGESKTRVKRQGKIMFLHPYSNRVFNMTAMLDASKHGCSCCSEAPTEEYLRQYPLFWFNSNEYLCDTCNAVNEGFGLRITQHSVYPYDN